MDQHISAESLKGLTSLQVKEKFQSEGFNLLPSSKPRNYLSIFLGVFREPMFILLVACGTLYLVMGDVQGGLMLLGFVFVIMGIEFFQERKTEKALTALKDMASPRALVIRDGVETRIPGFEVVTGDIIILQEGDRVPADATVLDAVSLLADESLLTGEPESVRKSIWDGTTVNLQPGGDDLPFVYSGSMIVRGNGIARVTAIGVSTEIGKIGHALGEVQEAPTLLKTEMRSLVKKLTIVAAILCIIVVVADTLTRGNLANGFLAGITLAMAILPEEFPVILTVFMALGAWRMSKKQVLTRNPSAIETLGSATVLCTDKTGTLTHNRMTVTRLYNGKDFLAVPGKGELDPAFHELVEFGILAGQASPFDPMEKAITAMGDRYLAGTDHIHTNWEMIREYPLTRELLAMSRVFTLKGTPGKVIAAKGAPEAVFELCHPDEAKRIQFSAAVETLAGDGLRLLGVARARIDATGLPDRQQDFNFEFIGLIGLTDPIRANVKQAVSECYDAGIRVIMITGDYPVTARHIAGEIGLAHPGSCLTGEDLQSMTEDELCRRIGDVNVFARVVPEQKLKIVNALKKNGEIVAMTGDGVNDAPALKAANIGISMGKKGTDVAREASSLVLMDDNFSSIVGAIRMGRRIFDNLQKAFGYTFAIHVPIAGLSLIPVFLANFPIILWPVHIVFLELIIDPACSIIFEAEKEESNVMQRRPRGLDMPFFGGRKILFSCLQGAGILLVTLSVYFFALNLGYDASEVRAMVFITLIVSNLAVILTNRSWTDNIFRIIATPNSAVLWVTGGALFFLVLVLHIPFFLELFRFSRPSPVGAFICTLAGLTVILWFEIYKLLQKNKGASRKRPVRHKSTHKTDV